MGCVVYRLPYIEHVDGIAWLDAEPDRIRFIDTEILPFAETIAREDDLTRLLHTADGAVAVEVDGATTISWREVDLSAGGAARRRLGDDVRGIRPALADLPRPSGSAVERFGVASHQVDHPRLLDVRRDLLALRLGDHRLLAGRGCVVDELELRPEDADQYEGRKKTDHTAHQKALHCVETGTRVHAFPLFPWELPAQ